MPISTSHMLIVHICIGDSVEEGISTRAVESESLKVGKSLKIGKTRIKSEKSDLISY